MAKVEPIVGTIKVGDNLTITLYYRKKFRKVQYKVVSVNGYREGSKSFNLFSKRSPCEVPHMEDIYIDLEK
jgi:hypothetical protein